MRIPRALLTVLLAALLVIAVSAGPGPAAPIRTRTLEPRLIPVSAAAEIPNSMRGQYSWLGSAPLPADWPVLDVYYRDQVVWRRLEPTAGSYDFSWFDEGLAAAEARGGRFGFRVMAWCPGCWIEATPDWLPTQPGTDIPDWNGEAFLGAWERLVGELGRRYADDPRLGWVDVGGYGKWGEWHVDPGSPAITTANAKRMIAAVLRAFPDQHVVINAMDPQLTLAAVRISPRLGLRVDCLGEFNMFSLIPTSAELQQVWKRAPVLSEWCGTATTDTVEGARQVRRYHVSQTSSGNLRTPWDQLSPAQRRSFLKAAKAAGYRYAVRSLTVPELLPRGARFAIGWRWRNLGSAPTYDGWRVELGLLDHRGRVVSRTRSKVDLRTVLPGTRRYAERVRFSPVRPGSYRLAVRVLDPEGYLDPMLLSEQGGLRDGWYALGRVRVG